MTSSPTGFPDVTAVIEKSHGKAVDDAKGAKRSSDSDSSIRWTVGYCTNIHAGADVAGVTDNLQNISAEAGS